MTINKSTPWKSLNTTDMHKPMKIIKRLLGGNWLTEKQ